MSNSVVEAELPPVAGRTALDEEQFATSLLQDLGRRTFSSAATTFFAQGIQALIGLLTVLVMARLLVPRDFGLVAMVTALTGVLVIIRDGGLTVATVQKEDITHAQVSNLFWINVAIGVGLACFAAAVAPLIAQFYKEPRLTWIAIAVGGAFLLRGPTIQQIAVLKRQMRFRTIAVIEIGSTVVGFAVGVSLALSGSGYWSLVGSMLAIEATRLVLASGLSTWRPRFPARGAGTGSLVRFGASMTAGGFLYYASRSLDRLLLGRFYGADSVGIYSRGAALFTRPLDQLLFPVESVLVPALSRLQTDPVRYRRTFLQCYESLAVTGCLLGGLLLPLARPFTIVLLGQRWEKAADILFAFGIAAVCRPTSAAATWLLSTQGRGNDYIVTNIISSLLIVCAVVAALPFGAVGIALSLSLSGLLVRIPILYGFIGRRGPVNGWDLCFRFMRHLPLLMIVWFATYVTSKLLHNAADLTVLLTGVVTGGVVAAVTVLMFPYQRCLLRDGMSIIWRLMHSARGSC
jgi:O-antigen/teichoic acid export membrane protein